MIKKEEHAKDCAKAAALIQRDVQKHSEQRASTISSQPSLALASSVLWDSATDSIALSFENDDDSYISEENSSDKAANQFEDNGASKGDMTAVTVPYYEGENDMEEENEQRPEERPKKWSGHFMRGVAVRAAGLIGAVVGGWMMGGAPVDDDDVVGVTCMVKSVGDGGSSGAGGVGGGGGGTASGVTGTTTSAQ
jgi:hypothetical protein